LIVCPARSASLRVMAERERAQLVVFDRRREAIPPERWNQA
jgi:hypothetical protein